MTATLLFLILFMLFAVDPRNTTCPG